ncbi:MAG: hypothetical protein ACXWBM_08780, partial [Chthoniobacterales bacterium]
MWPEVLSDISAFTSGGVSGILAKDPTKKCVNANFHAGLDPHFQRLYAETYGKLGPVAITLPGEVEQVSSIPELIPY